MELSNEMIELIKEKATQQWGNVHRTGLLGFIDGATTALTDPEILASVKCDGWVKKEDVAKVILWMCGYNESEFPARKENDPPHYWRSILREQFEKIGVDADKYLPQPPKK